MDRFIENVAFAQTVFLIILKSNMDRFIDFKDILSLSNYMF